MAVSQSLAGPDEHRRRRREEARRRTRRQRRVAALVLALLVLAPAAALLAGKGGSERPARASREASAPPQQLPRGGRRLFPDYRVVAFYGAPQDPELGALGIGTPAQAAERLARQARPYRRPGRPVMPAFELIATVADASPGDDGSYSTRQPHAVVRRYLSAARRARALLILDVQPGRADFMEEVRALSPFLAEPDVGLALDPEWSVRAGQVPGRQIGSTDAGTVDDVSRYLARIVRERRLPEKPLIVHQFTHDMIEGEERIAARRGVPVILNVDGFGGTAVKVSKYRSFARQAPRLRKGFKLFYEEDLGLMTPRQVIAMKPSPDVVVYE